VVVDVDFVDSHPKVGVGTWVPLRRLEAAEPVPFLRVDDAQFDEAGDLGGVAQGGEPQDRPPRRPLLPVLAVETALFPVLAVDVVVRRVRPRRRLADSRSPAAPRARRSSLLHHRAGARSPAVTTAARHPTTHQERPHVRRHAS
jgi:hypothetical protein